MEHGADIRRLSSDNCRQTGVGYLRSTNLQFSRSLPYLSSFWNKVDIIIHYDNNRFWISAEKNKNDLEWPWIL